MNRTARWLTYVAAGIAVICGLVGVFLAAGQALEEVRSGVPVALVALWLLAVSLLGGAAVRRTQRAEPVILMVGILLVGFIVFDIFMPMLPRDDGPRAAVLVLGYAVVLALLGLKRPLTAGVMLLVIVAAQFAHQTLYRYTTGTGEWFVSGPVGALSVPVFLVAVLMVTAGLLNRQEARRLNPRPSSKARRRTGSAQTDRTAN